jgi:voltage-gated potassium channel Kch
MVMLSLGVLVSAADPSLQYLIWLIPFVILAGWVRAATVLQLALVAPVAIFYLPAIDHTLSSPASPWSHAVTNLVYVPSMDGLWLAGVLALLVMLAREVRTWSVAHRGAAQPSRPT